MRKSNQMNDMLLRTKAVRTPKQGGIQSASYIFLSRLQELPKSMTVQDQSKAS